MSLWLFFWTVGFTAVLCQKGSTSPIGEGQCIWYDTCDVNPEKTEGVQYLNCRYDGPAILLDDANSVGSLQRSCPELVDDIADENGSLYTCCSPDSISIMTEQLSLLTAILSRCPACISNLRKSFCFFACHPRQSNFLMPTKLHYNDTTGNDSIWSVIQYTNPTYTNDAYDSCEKVYYPEMNMPALGILCGPWGVDHCTAERLFDYFGNNPFAPFNITYEYVNKPVGVWNDVDKRNQTYEPFNPETVPCNTNDTKMHCLCSDCADSCPPPPEPNPPKEHIMVGGIRLFAFILIILYFMYLTLVVLTSIIIGLPGSAEGQVGCWPKREKLSAQIEYFFQDLFEREGRFVARNPGFVLLIGLLCIAFLSYGVTNLKMTTDPVKLWAAPGSQTRLDKDYYDKSFGPFYRTTQIIIAANESSVDGFNLTVADSNTGMEYDYEFGTVFDSEFMKDVLDLQLQVMNLTAQYLGKTVTLNDICIKPLYPANDICMIQSVMNYWQNDPDQLESMMVESNPTEYAEFFLICTSNPTYYGNNGERCLATYGGPVLPYVALGGFLEENQSIADGPSYEHATAHVLTFLIQNYMYPDLIGPALAWELVFIDFMKNFTHENMSIAFNAERGIEDEIIRQGKSDITTIIISYLVMFTYVSLALGGLNIGNPSRFCVETKITMGLASVIIVFFAFVSAVGFCGMIGIEGTLFVIEVIPFLVLAVGVDNIFLLVQTWQRMERHENESIEDHVGRVVGKIAPSMLLATTAETICFFLGALSEMPAVYAFSIFAGVALTIDFILQITCLVAFVTLDAKRIKENRYDVLCCVKGPMPSTKSGDEDCCFKFFEHIYAPFLMNNWVRTIVLLLFPALFVTSCIYTPHLDIGLEQDLSMPDDSFVLKYFNYMNLYLSVGPPVYYVIQDEYSFPNFYAQNLICSSSGCQDDSMLTQIFVASTAPEVSYIATGASSWIDAYYAYISDNVGGSNAYACCRLDENGEFIDSGLAYDLTAKSTCLKSDQFINGTNRPLPQYFMENLPYFLKDNPHDTSCPSAGHPAYGDAVNIIETEGNRGWNDTAVGANYFMAYHKILKTSADFTNGVREAYNLCDQLTIYLRKKLELDSDVLIPEISLDEKEAMADLRVLPYSIFYVYYEQYLTMWHLFGKSIGVSLVAVFLVMAFMTGFDLRSTFINLTIIFMVFTDITAFMVWWNIQLNAVSLVNLVMAIGISVEFCSHISHAFAMVPNGSKTSRAQRALSYTGSSVFSGITLTKFGGIIVLAFATSKIIKVYYFRMYLLIVLLGASHSLIFLPVLLSVMGPNINPFFKLAKEGKEKGRKVKVKRKPSKHEMIVVNKENPNEIIVNGFGENAQSNNQAKIVIKGNTIEIYTNLPDEQSGTKHRMEIIELPKRDHVPSINSLRSPVSNDEEAPIGFSMPSTSHTNEAFESDNIHFKSRPKVFI